MAKKESAVVQVMSQLWNNKQQATGHSWLRMNQGLRDGLFLCVRLGLEFGEDDLSSIYNRFRGGFWFGSNFEHFYTTAVIYGNRSAWKAYEKYARRTPFIFKPARLRDTWGAGGQGINNPPRLTVGAEFAWSGEWVSVTSFNDEHGYLIAQSYMLDKSDNCKACGQSKNHPQRRTLHRHKITLDDVKNAKAAKRAAAKVA